MDKDQLSSELREIRLFSSFTDTEFKRIVLGMAVKEFRKNTVVLHEEDTNEFMYIVLSGKVKAVRSTEEGKEAILAIHGAGEFFGEISLIDGKTMPATVSAMEDSRIAVISKKDFRELFLSQKKFLDDFLNILCLRLRDSWRRIEMLNFNNASHRIKMLLTALSEESGEKSPEGVTIQSKLTHQNIADMAGLTRETVSRVLEEWVKSGDISLKDNKLIHLTPAFLKKDFRM